MLETAIFAFAAFYFCIFRFHEPQPQQIRSTGPDAHPMIRRVLGPMTDLRDDANLRWATDQPFHDDFARLDRSGSYAFMGYDMKPLEKRFKKAFEAAYQMPVDWPIYWNYPRPETGALLSNMSVDYLMDSKSRNIFPGGRTVKMESHPDFYLHYNPGVLPRVFTMDRIVECSEDEAMEELVKGDLRKGVFIDESNQSLKEGKQLAVSGEQSLGESKQLAVSGEQSLKESKQLAVSGEQSLEESQQLAVSGEQSLEESKQLAVSSEQSEKDGKQLAVSSEQYAPTGAQLPLTAHRLPLTGQSPPLTAYRSPLTVHHSPLTAHRLLLTDYKSFNPGSEEEYIAHFNELQSANPITKLDFTNPNKIELDIEITRPAMLVFTEIWYPGWEARLNGEPVPLNRVNYLQRGVWLDRGEHRVELVFRPRAWRIGAIISLLSWLGVIILSLVWVIRKFPEILRDPELSNIKSRDRNQRLNKLPVRSEG